MSREESPADISGGATAVTPDPDGVAALLEKLRATGRTVTNFVALGAVAKTEKTFAHGCAGEIGSATYQDDSGATHVVGYSWYDCESYMEILGDIVDLSPH